MTTNIEWARNPDGTKELLDNSHLLYYNRNT